MACWRRRLQQRLKLHGMKDPKSTSSVPVGQNFSFDLKDGLLWRSQDFHLEPFDEIYVRKSPSYFKQQNVMVGEKSFSVVCTIEKNERLSDLIAKAMKE